MNLQTIYRGKELPLADYFESKKASLATEFLTEYPEFNSIEPLPNSDLLQNKITEALGNRTQPGPPWELLQIKGTYHFNGPYRPGLYSIDESRSKFPTATSFINYFGEAVRSISYSVLEPHSIIARHWDHENREGEFIRVHIPLIIPPGDLGMEVNGEVINWSETIGFNNLLFHSVWNFTDYRRLILILDLQRSHLGLPNEPPWTEKIKTDAVPFPKTSKFIARQPT